MKPRIFDQEQIARAVELCLGAFSAAGINMIAADKNSQDYKKRVEEILKKEWPLSELNPI